MPLVAVHASHEALVFPYEPFDGMPGVSGACGGAVALPGQVAGGLVHAAGAVLRATSPLVAARVVSVTEALRYVHLKRKSRKLSDMSTKNTYMHKEE